MKKGQDPAILIGNAIRKRREEMNISQEAYAELVGVHRTYYSAVERGKRNVSVKALMKVCEGLEVKLWEILKDCGI